MEKLRFQLNGRWVEASGLSPTTTVLRYLRDQLGMTGTKEGCAEGDCGACSVAVLEHDLEGRATWRAINGCLVFLPMVQGKQLFTVEGLEEAGAPHAVQESLAKHLGSQCGYCTPGVVMSMFEACYREDIKEPWELDAQMCGNLCRCTGYRPIREATEAIAGLRPLDRFTRALHEDAPIDMALRYRAGAQRFFTPTTLDALWDVLAGEPDARFVAGGTDLGLEVTKRFAEPPVLVLLEGLAELRTLRPIPGGIRIGSGVTLTDLEAYARGRLPSLERMLRYFGARQVKNRGTLGGNICNASPIGDMPPVMLAADATFVLASRRGERRVKANDFFLGYRKTALERGEILAAVELPTAPAHAKAASYKVSKRRELDISCVSASFHVELGEDGRIALARLAYGGVAATPARAWKTEAALVGRLPSAEVIAEALPKLAEDFTPLSDHRGSAKYRSLLARNLLIGFFEETKKEPQPRLPWPHTATVNV